MCANHISYVDPFAIARTLLDVGINPYFLAKDSLFTLPVAGRLLRGSGQIPVYRGTSRSGQAFDAAVQAIDQGKVVVIFPEGTITRDDELWPMSAKTGAARIAAATGCDIVPAATWGGHHIAPAYGRGRGRMRGRREVFVRYGTPVRGPDGAEQLPAAGRKIMGAIARELCVLRGVNGPSSRI